MLRLFEFASSLNDLVGERWAYLGMTLPFLRRERSAILFLSSTCSASVPPDPTRGARWKQSAASY